MFPNISSRHKQQILANCDHDKRICETKIQVSSVDHLIKSVILIYYYGQE